ncbi:hypothetical protein CCR94_17515 [Rhodoblastus sphagnicola]|uniref:Small multidrug resistance protein n=1 Tax=Rhodoblastus sphagnicola TaxID=333368 RepID=A0A2S6N1J5_9HYPH|nr:hypothetical protein [Rhodoblastus sphagnicola]MBB4200765.1 multidrug transporter EmrE-like cation transporter [Rhodoblastus sphagnicola]PPQ28494.1 hypothetical protein CCR94_17515 [Rhodoblastus sphagnicola]
MSVSLMALVFAILANSGANILIKKAGTVESGLASYISVWFIAGLVLFGLNLVAYTFAVRSIALSVAYPILVGGSLVLIAAYTSFGLQESFGVSKLAGYAFVIAGAYLIVR